jgi:hypothetical protein
MKILELMDQSWFFKSLNKSYERDFSYPYSAKALVELEFEKVVARVVVHGH